MDLSAFNITETERYATEAKEKWGKTEAYKEFEQKTAGQAPARIQATGDALMAIFAELGTIRHLPPSSQEAQALIAKLHAFITTHYYTCTKQILLGLSQMYIAGDSMTDNIDRAGGAGTAQFAHDAIVFYCK